MLNKLLKKLSKINKIKFKNKTYSFIKIMYKTCQINGNITIYVINK